MRQPDIDALARLLEGDPAEGEVPAEARALGAFARAIEGAAPAPPPFARKSELRAALLDAAREQAANPGLLTRMRGSLNDATARWRYSARLAGATAASAMALSTGGVAVASQQALPGDVLYGVKLALEDAGLLFVGDQVARGEQQLINAGERMEEAHRSAERGDMAGVQRALREADAAGRAGAGDIIAASQDRGDPSLLDLLATFSTQQRQRLLALMPLLSGDAEMAANDVMVGLNRIDQRVAVLGGSCEDCGAATADAEDSPATSTAPREDVADARDFDFSEIPAASEPFSACPCVGAATPASRPGAADDEAEEAVDDAEDETEERPKGPADEPEPADPDDEEPDESPLPDVLPPPVDEPVREIEDEADDVIEDVLDELPVDRPADTPDADTSGDLPADLP